MRSLKHMVKRSTGKNKRITTHKRRHVGVSNRDGKNESEWRWSGGWDRRLGQDTVKYLFCLGSPKQKLKVKGYAE
jgi:hypothetical protein